MTIHRFTHSLSQLLSLRISSGTFVIICPTPSIVKRWSSSRSLKTKGRLWKGTGLLSLNLKSSLARLCTELFKFLFKWRTVYSCQIVCHWWDDKFTVYMCQFCIDQSWFRKAQQVPCLLLWCCLTFLFIATVQMWRVAALWHAVLLWLRPSTSSACCTRGRRRRSVDNCLRRKRRTMSRRGPSCPPGGTSKGQVLRSAFHFQKNSYLSHLSWIMPFPVIEGTESVWLVVIKDPNQPWIPRSSSVAKPSKRLDP